jgi:predicted  nucleic acid-binding Zn-ribbon protein
VNLKSNLELCDLDFQLNQDIQVRSNEAQREMRKKDKIERELKQAKADLDAKVSEIKTLNQTLEKLKGENSKLEMGLKEQRVRPEGRLPFSLS